MDTNEMWLEPTADSGSIESILRYAYTVNGYEYAERCLKVDCVELHQERLALYENTGEWRGTFEELRCCLSSSSAVLFRR